MKYTSTIENGVTIINTGDSIGGLKNKTGHAGVYWLEHEGKYVSRICIGKRAYTLGRNVNLEDAAAIRAEAERHRQDGTFLEWYLTLEGRTKRKSPTKKK